MLLVWVFYMLNKICGIYKITSPAKRIYIGQSIDIINRWKRYGRLHCNHQSILFNSFNKYGFEKHTFEILQQCEREKLNELEKYYVDLYQTFNSKNGMNLRDGGGSKAKTSDETKLKIKLNSPKYWLGKKIPKEATEKYIKTRTGMKMSIESRLNISNGHKGIIFSEEHKTKLKIAAKKRGNNNVWKYRTKKQTDDKTL